VEAIWPDAPLLTAEQTAALAEAFVPMSTRMSSIHVATQILRMKTSSLAIAPASFDNGLGSRSSSV